MGLDKTAQGYQEEGIMKLLKDIRDSLAGNVIIPAKPPSPNDDGDDNGNDDNGDDNGNDDNGNDNGNDDNGDDKTIFIDLSWINDLQLYKKLLQKFSLDTMEIKIHLNYLLFELL